MRLQSLGRLTFYDFAGNVTEPRNNDRYFRNGNVQAFPDSQMSAA
jgi:hypothetical protein